MTEMTPLRLQTRHKAGLRSGRLAAQRPGRLAAQPWLGLGGLLLAAAVFFALALGTGSPTTSLLILGPISTFALPAVAVIAFWWNDWPGARLTRPWTGLTRLHSGLGYRTPQEVLDEYLNQQSAA
jgi:hypothetical protein